MAQGESLAKINSSPEGDKTIGMVIRTNLCIESLLGKGGMGRVYLAYHEVLKRKCAVKVLSKQLTDEPTFQQRFLAEAQQQAALEHSNIVKVIDFFEEQGEYFLVLEYIDGKSLATMIEEGKKLPERDAIRIIQDILNGLQCAHQKSIIHRDVKPSNILIDQMGKALLCDFGISIQTDAPRLTGEKTIGTSAYMSPEQFCEPTKVSPCSDIYSAGIVLFEMLTGKVPFDGPTDHAIGQQHLSTPPPDPRSINPEISEGVARVILKALAKNPDQRFQSCAEFREALLPATILRPRIDPKIRDGFDSRIDPKWPLRRLALIGTIFLFVGIAAIVWFVDIQKKAVWTLVASASQTLKVTCRDFDTLGIKKKGKLIAEQIPDSATAKKFSDQISELDKNIDDSVLRYSEYLSNLKSYRRGLIRETLEKNSTTPDDARFNALMGEHLAGLTAEPGIISREKIENGCIR